MFDSDKRKYIYEDYLFQGDWFVDANGFLYIIPLTDDDVDGPDGELLDKINEKVRELDDFPIEEAEKLGLTPVPQITKRFSEKDGYYYA